MVSSFKNEIAYEQVERNAIAIMRSSKARRALKNMLSLDQAALRLQKMLQRRQQFNAFGILIDKFRRRTDQDILEAKHFFIYFIKALQSRCTNESIFFCRKLESALRVNDLMLFKEDLNLFEGFEFLRLNLELKR